MGTLELERGAYQETIELLQELVRLSSVNPPGDEDRIAKYVADFLEENRIEARLIPLEEGRSSVIAEIPGEERGSIVLCGHLDTVGVNEARWSRPPFAGIIEGDRLYGRGASDMKGGVAIILEAAKLLRSMLHDKNERPRQTILLALTADEEQEYRGAQQLTAQGFFDDAEFMIVTEPTDGKVFIGEKGELWVRARFSGKAAHGATPELGVSALLPAAAFCTRITNAAAREFKKENELWGRSTLTIGRLTAGWRVNVVPDSAEVELDFRVISEKDRERALQLVDSLGREEASRAGAGFSSEVFSYHPPVFTERENDYVQAFLRAARAVIGHEPAVGISPYCADAATIVPETNRPFIIYGPGTIALAHQPDEYIELSSLEQSLRVLLNFLAQVTGISA